MFFAALDTGASVNAADAQGRTAVMRALAYGPGHVRHTSANGMLVALLSRGPELNTIASDVPMESILGIGTDRTALNDIGNTALNEAIRSRWPLALITLLLDRGARVQTPGPRPTSQPLHLAVRRSHPQQLALIALLLARGADLGLKDAYLSQAPMCMAADGQPRAVAEALLAAGASDTPGQAIGCNPLQLAVTSDSLALSELFIARGADPKFRLSNGTTLWNLNAQPAMRAMLATHGVTPNVQRADLRGPRNDTARWWSEIFHHNASTAWLSANLVQNLPGVAPWDLHVNFDGRDIVYREVAWIKLWRVPASGQPELQQTLGVITMPVERRIEHVFVPGSAWGRFYAEFGFAAVE
jgi:ankyrin repeat protein